MIKVEYGILPADDFTNGGDVKVMIQQIENFKIDNRYIDNTISELNSIDNNTSHYDAKYFEWLTTPIISDIINHKKQKRKRKPKLRKRRSI